MDEYLIHHDIGIDITTMINWILVFHYMFTPVNPLENLSSTPCSFALPVYAARQIY